MNVLEGEDEADARRQIDDALGELHENGLAYQELDPTQGARPRQADPDPVHAVRDGVRDPASETLLVELGKLAPPAGDEKQVTAILHAQRTAIDTLKANPAALAREDPFATTQRLAAAYGLKACGPSS